MTHSINRRFVVWMIMILAVLGVAADCSSTSGTYQGGNDSSPYYR